MIQKIKRYILVTIAGLTLLAPGLATGVASATTITGELCSGSNLDTSSTDCKGSNTDLKHLASIIINAFSVIVGVVAVVMVIVGGFRYITSGGESNSVTGAKNTLVYAIVGLIIVALAQFIVHFVLNTATNTGLAG